jgi:hypothetical protein
MTAIPHDRRAAAAPMADAIDLDATAEFPALRLEDFAADGATAGVEFAAGAPPTPGGELLRRESAESAQIVVRHGHVLGSARASPAAPIRGTAAPDSTAFGALKVAMQDAQLTPASGGVDARAVIAAREAMPAAHAAKGRERAATASACAVPTVQPAAAEPELAAARHSEAALSRSAPAELDPAAVTTLRRQLRDAEARATRYFEQLSSREWQRGVWEGIWQDLDAQLDASRAAAALAERRCTALAAEVAELNRALATRDATIVDLQAAGAAQIAALRAQVESGAERERQGRAQLDAALSAAARATLENASRIAELEATCAAAAQTLQEQLARAERASAQLAQHERQAADLSRKIRYLETELEAARRSAAAASAAACEAIAQLTTRTERLAAADRATADQPAQRTVSGAD